MKNIIIVSILLLSFACHQEYVQEPKTLSSIKKAKVTHLKPTKEPLPVHVAGKVEASENMKLSFLTGGIIKKLYVNEGQLVRKGQVLAELDPEEINAQVTQANANVEKLERDLVIFKRLYIDSAATLQSVQDLETRLEVAYSSLSITKYNQQYSKITAPVSGRILQKIGEEYELINPGQPVYTLSTQAAGLVLNVGLSDRDVIRLQLGNKATIIFDAYPGKEANATVTKIAADGHSTTGTFEVELAIKDFPFELKSGFFAHASIFPSHQNLYFKVPMHAIIDGLEDKVAIYAPHEGKAKKVIVTPQYIGKDFFTVNALQKEFAVITEGAAYLKEGEAFKPLN